ncbi:TerB family tellurite resistance protein [Siccirubricoccus sp. KC 17139]|uniref:TerB family tellurite resistance protein n=1 Tax=Siccirubricoccus soli TaxID=2899147 RepID=A0ABT1DBT6_9PROT|nr:TerB family tellurite resistance protein [Siccirubricoccus soli]MCO6419401.1 TerB family tellurite resistance protein [Siccirubricoccus soli]MCP2685536.1 TerB family tellurite resistance protein [Siccirubricoccus soli]
MSFWGKVIGGVAGFVTGGPLGAVVGAALGHAADQGGSPFGNLLGRSAAQQAADMAALLGSKEQLFAISVVVLAAKLAKCDGAVKREEIDAFKRLFRIPPESLREVGQLFDHARDSQEDYRPFAERLGQTFADNKGMLEDVLAAFFQIARADGPLTRAEVAFLQRVQLGFGLDAAAWERARDGQRPPGAAPQAGPDPYAILGVPPEATDDVVRQAWRKLMRENHPDSLAARGVPQEFVRRATEKVAEINAAWDRIKRERKL